MPYIAEKCQVTYGEENYGSFAVAPSSKARVLGLTNGASVPGPANELLAHWFIGAGREVYDIGLGKQKNEGLSFDLFPTNFRFLNHFLGKVADVGTDSPAGGGSTLNGATVIGATTVVLVAATSYVTNDYIQIDVGALAEIRKITNVATNTLTLDEQLRRAHASGVACNEVIAPFTHTLTVGSLMVDGKNLPSNTMELAYTETGATDIVLQFCGCMGDHAELSCAEGEELKAALTYLAAKVTKQTTVESLTLPTSSPFVYTTGSLTWNAVAIARLKTVKMSFGNGGAMKHYIRSTDGRYAYEYIPSKFEAKFSAEFLPDDATILDDVLAGTERAVVMKFEKSATDYVQVNGNIKPESLKMNIPESGEVGGSLEGMLSDLSVTVVDSIDHY